MQKQQRLNEYWANTTEYEEKINKLEVKVREYEEAGAECMAIK